MNLCQKGKAILLRLTVREPPGEIFFFFEEKRELMTKKRDGPSIRAIWRGKVK